MVTKNLNVMQRSFAGCYLDLLWDMLLHQQAGMKAHTRTNSIKKLDKDLVKSNLIVARINTQPELSQTS